MKINKKLKFIPVLNDFNKRWSNILKSAEEKLVNLLLSLSDNAVDNLQTKKKEGLQNNYGTNTEESFKNLEEKHQDYKNKLTHKRDNKWKTLEKNREILMSTNIEVQREKAKVRNNLEREELLTNKNKGKYRKNLLLTIDTKDVREKLKRTNKGQQPSEICVTYQITGKRLLASA